MLFVEKLATPFISSAFGQQLDHDNTGKDNGNNNANSFNYSTPKDVELYGLAFIIAVVAVITPSSFEHKRFGQKCGDAYNVVFNSTYDELL